MILDNHIESIYNSFNAYVRRRFGERAWKIPIEAGMTCPNRNTDGSGGCTFCTEDGSSAGRSDPSHSIAEQLYHGIDEKRSRFKANKFIAYLQSFTNTFASHERLQSLYSQAIDHPDIVMLAVGTRPDCLPDRTLQLLQSYTDRVEVWLDIGVQSLYDSTLQRINRGHSADDFFWCVERAAVHAPSVKLCIHTMVGLPGETLEMAANTIETVVRQPIHGLKIHNLCIVKNTPIAAQYQSGMIQTLELDEYIDFLVRVLPRIPPHIIIHRLMAEPSDRTDLIAPSWANNKNLFMKTLQQRLIADNIHQGAT